MIGDAVCTEVLYTGNVNWIPMTQAYLLSITQALPDAEVRLGGGDDVEPDPNTGRDRSTLAELAPHERARLEEALWRNDFFRDCMAQAQLALKVRLCIMRCHVGMWLASRRLTGHMEAAMPQMPRRLGLAFSLHVAQPLPGQALVSRNYNHKLHNKTSRQCCCAAQVGAQVMLLKNLDLEAGAGRMLVNGSRGVVTGFRDRAEVMQLDLGGQGAGSALRPACAHVSNPVQSRSAFALGNQCSRESSQCTQSCFAFCCARWRRSCRSRCSRPGAASLLATPAAAAPQPVPRPRLTLLQ